MLTAPSLPSERPRERQRTRAWSLCINTQTPLVQFLPPTDGRPPISDLPEVSLAGLTEGVDYRYSPGGVTRMVYPLVRRLSEAGLLGNASWVSLNPTGPSTVRLPAMTLYNVRLAPEQMDQYGRVKEAIWGRMHEVDGAAPRDDLFWSEAFAEYAYYNRACAELIRGLDRRTDFDAFYIHDFQQLPVGQMLGTLKPKIFRWHIPFDAASVPEHWRAMLRAYLASYDVVVVSSRRYAEALRQFGYPGRVVRMCPYIDPRDYRRPPPEEADRLCARFGLAPEEEIALVVGRMDPIKGQDLAIEAFAAIAADHPALRLVLVGNGSFSGTAGGPGGGKAQRWRERLQRLVRERGLEDRVRMVGHVSQAELDALYERSRFTVMPSVREGFGLVAVESWLHERPVIVTTRAGISELMEDGRDGLLFEPDRPGELADRMARLAEDPGGELRRRLVRGARRTAELCSIDAAIAAERALLHEVLEA